MNTRQHCRGLILLTALVIGLPAQAADNFDDAMHHFRNGHYDIALADFQALARKGHKDAQFQLGLMNHLGRGVPKNSKQALHWYRKAAEQGHPSAQNNLGVMYRDGDDIRADKVLAYMWFNLSASQMNSRARRSAKELEDYLSRSERLKAQQLTAEYSENRLKRLRESRISADTPPKFMVQLGLFGNTGNVERIRKKLKGARLEIQDRRVELKGKHYYLVRVGPYYNEKQAEDVAKRMDILFNISSSVIPVGS